MPVLRTARWIGCTALLCVGAVAQAHAKSIEGVEFADRYTAGDVSMPLNCVGLLRYMVFIKGYVAALYLGPGVRPDDVLSDVPKRLEMNYFYAIKGPDFARAGDAGMAANVDASLKSQLLHCS